MWRVPTNVGNSFGNHAPETIPDFVGNCCELFAHDSETTVHVFGTMSLGALAWKLCGETTRFGGRLTHPKLSTPTTYCSETRIGAVLVCCPI